MHTLTIRAAFALLSIATFGAAASPTSAGAQDLLRASDARVRIAQVDSLPLRTASAMVVRKGGQLPLVVLDRAHATPETLGMALALVKHLRRTPLAEGQQQVVPIQGGVARVQPSARRATFLRTQLRRLTERPLGRIGTLGTGRYIEVVDEPTMPVRSQA